MNDRFKFRVWDLDAKRIQWPTYLPCNPNYEDHEAIHNVVEDGITTFIETCPPNPGPIEDYIIMQCTGLKDKNGKLIYEGDIVINFHLKEIPNNIHWRVEWNMCRYDLLPWDKHHYDKEDLVTVPDMYNSHALEIIGNIYENPELLKD